MPKLEESTSEFGKLMDTIEEERDRMVSQLSQLFVVASNFKP